MDFVIGSGPSAMAATAALLARGKEVTIIDSGLSLESEREKLRAKLSSKEPNDWSGHEIEAFKAGMESTSKGIPKKLIYGSNYVYRDVCGARPLSVKDAKVTRSFAAGGLSNVWGACIAPYPLKELSDWPQASRNLDAHFRSVLKLIPHSGAKDGLADHLPLYSENYDELSFSRQASFFKEDLEKNREILSKRGILFGAARLAVRNQKQSSSKSCRNCGLCLYGCPYGLIYSSAHTLSELTSQDKVKYMGHHFVERLEEKGGEVFISGRDLSADTHFKLKAKRVFVGCGVVETARLMLDSLELYNQPILAKHSDRFMLPFIRFKGAPGVDSEAMHTLSQLFIEISDQRISQHSAHLQLYTYNDLYLKALQKKFGSLANLFKLPMNLFLQRLMILFGYLHSDVSSRFSFTLTNSSRRELVVEGQPNSEAKKVAKRLTAKLWANLPYLKGLPTISFLDPPGGGNHSGATFPMAEKPQEFESDILGRPYGFKQVHIVDSSVFPSLAAATITLTAMANAYRIASECD